MFVFLRAYGTKSQRALLILSFLFYRSNRDKAIFGLLAKCVTSTTDISESLKAREELTRKLDSKSALSEYLYLVFDFASFSIDNAAVVSSLADNLCKQNPILGSHALAC